MNDATPATESISARVSSALERLDGRVCVVGSINADLVVRVERMPKPGETIQGSPLRTISGGKSANQAAAASRIGARVQLVGAVGADALAEVVTSALEDAGVDLTHVRHLTDTPTGTAVITVDAAGENSIIISAGANGELGPGEVEESAEALTSAGALGLVFEVPPATVLAAALTAHGAGVPVVLNPSPYRRPEPELLKQIDVLVVNEHELADMLGDSDASSADDGGGGDDQARWSAVAERVRTELGIPSFVVTLGGDGAVVIDGTAGADDTGEPLITRVQAVKVTPVDTTGCGDAFTGTLLAGIASGLSLAESAEVAAAVGAYAATKEGAQTSYPGPDDVRALLAATHA